MPLNSLMKLNDLGLWFTNNKWLNIEEHIKFDLRFLTKIKYNYIIRKEINLIH